MLNREKIEYMMNKNLDIDLTELGGTGTTNVSYDYTKDGKFIGISDGSKTAIEVSTQEDSISGATGNAAGAGFNTSGTVAIDVGEIKAYIRLR